MTSQNPLEGRNDLKGLLFFYYLPNYNIYKKKYLCTLIEKNLGTITSSLFDDIWIIIEDLYSLSNKEFNKLILNKGGIILYYNKKRYYKTIINHPKNIFNCIILNEILNNYKIRKNPLELLYEDGLPKNINSNSLIAINIPNIKSDKKLFYETFKKKSNNKYDFPIFKNKIPDGYSLFCTSSEENEINIYEDDNSSKESNILFSNDEIDNDIEPKGNFCALCKKQYLTYNIHLKSKEHIYYMKKNLLQYKNISNTFKRINSYYNYFNNNDTSLSLSNINSSSNNNFSTFDSLVNDLGNYYFTYEPKEILFRKYIGKKKKKINNN